MLIHVSIGRIVKLKEAWKLKKRRRATHQSFTSIYTDGYILNVSDRRINKKKKQQRERLADKSISQEFLRERENKSNVSCIYWPIKPKNSSSS